MEMMGKISYSFYYKSQCNMCAAPVTQSRVLGIRLNTSQGLHPKKVYGIGTSVLKCTNCGLIYSNPQPIPTDINDHYNIDPSEYWGEEYFSGEEHKLEHHAKRLKSFLGELAGKKALDIGTGVGFSMVEMQRMGFDVYGIEPSPQFVKYAIEKNGIPAEKLIVGMMEDGNYEPESFDFILMRVVLEHVYDPAACIEKALTWLKPSGILHIEVPSSNHLIAKFINLYYRLRGTTYVTNLSPAHSPYHLYEFSAKAFEKHGARCNYKIELAEYYPARVFFFPKFLHPMLKYIMAKTDTGMQLAVWLRKH